ncbi:MAG: PBP1A family penicillin-binding protein [Deltaproteobacteria bacterium]|nr:PBP1A family penicillin-binding protein [Deltaproteobacteria bacterium]
MTARRKRKTLLSIVSWTLVAGFVSFAALLFYCDSLFKEDVKQLMGETPRSQPSVIYSDVYLLKKGALYEDSFLTERLKELRIDFQESPEHVEWKGRSFDYPESLLPTGSPARVAPDEPVAIEIKDGRVESISIGGRPSDAVALEPLQVATLAGAKRSIKNYVAYADIPARMRLAFVSVEDQRFLEHMGFDPRSLGRAIFVNLRHGHLSQGGSTITQQLVKNLLATPQKTFFRKLKELVLAIMMERSYTKDQILEKYLNEVYFGQVGSFEVHGVAEAAHYFFNKSLDQLTLGETALIAGLVRGPVVYSPYKHLNAALERRTVVLKKMLQQDVIAQDEYREALAQKITVVPPSLANNHAPYFVDYVKSQVMEEAEDQTWGGDLSSEGLRIFTTIDLPLQRRADAVVAASVREAEARYKIARPLRLESILVAADPASGHVRALVGGRSYAETTFNRVLNMKRQVGSTFKPIAYLAALLKGVDSQGRPISGAYMIEDSPWTYKFGPGQKKSWSPHNYERGYRGKITLREAFANSINIPMAKIGTDIGIDNVIDVAHKLGITQPLPNVPSLVLGSVDLNPMELLQAYSTIANRGERVELTTVRAIVRENGEPLAHFESRREQEIEPRYVDLLSDLLGTVVKEGTAKLMPTLGYSKPAHGKTGTTNFARDAWFAGFSQGLVAVTWTGFDELKTPDSEDEEGARKFKSPALLTGAGAALPTWARFFAAAKPAKTFDPETPYDSSLERIKTDRSTGLRAKSTCPSELVYDELFLPNTAPSADCNLH